MNKTCEDSIIWGWGGDDRSAWGKIESEEGECREAQMLSMFCPDSVFKKQNGEQSKGGGGVSSP